MAEPKKSTVAAAKFREKNKAAGGRAVYSMVSAEAARALDSRPPGVSLRAALEQAIIAKWGGRHG